MSVDAANTQIYPMRSKAVDLSTTDANLVTYFPQGYARRIYVGGAGNVIVRRMGDAADVTYIAPPVGTVLFGIFTKVTRTGTTATNLVAEE